MSDNPEISVDLGITAVSFEGGSNDTFGDLYDKLDDFLQEETLEEVVKELKRHDFELDEEHEASVEANGPSGGTFQ